MSSSSVKNFAIIPTFSAFIYNPINPEVVPIGRDFLSQLICYEHIQDQADIHIFTELVHQGVLIFPGNFKFFL